MADADGLADFIRGLPEGQRHKGTFWALATAVEDDLPDAEVAKVAAAAVGIGLGEEYVTRTLREVRTKTP